MRRVCVHRYPRSGKIILITPVDQEAAWPGEDAGPDPEAGRARRDALPEPASRAGPRPGLPGQRVLRRPRRWCRSNTRWCARSRPKRRLGHQRRRGVRVLPAFLLRGSRRAGAFRAGGAGARPARAARRAQAHRGRSAPGPSSSWPPTPRCARRPWPGRSRQAFGVRVHPRQRRACAGPLPGAPLQKPLTCPPARCGRRRPVPVPGDRHLAARLLNRAPARMPARITLPAAGWTPVTSNCVMPPCTRAPRRSRSASAC